MQLKNLAVFLCSATALAAVEKRDDMQDAIDSAMDNLPTNIQNSVPTNLQDMPQPDPSLYKIIQTAVPKSLISNPEKAQEAASSIADGNPPQWVEDLPDEVKDYYNELGEWVKDNGDQITGNMPSPTGGSGDSDDSGSDSSSDSGSDDSGSEGSSNTETDSSETASSTGGAPAPTGAMAASVAGAVGILGLAVAL